MTFHFHSCDRDKRCCCVDKKCRLSSFITPTKVVRALELKRQPDQYTSEAAGYNKGIFQNDIQFQEIVQVSDMKFIQVVVCVVVTAFFILIVLTHQKVFDLVADLFAKGITAPEDVLENGN